MSEQAPQRFQGKIKFYQIKSGYGFIIPVDAEPTEDNGIFVHRSAVYDPKLSFPQKGEIVEYEVVNDNSGRPKATNVTRPNGRLFVKKTTTRPERTEGQDSTEKKTRGPRKDGGNRRRTKKTDSTEATDAEAKSE